MKWLRRCPRPATSGQGQLVRSVNRALALTALLSAPIPYAHAAGVSRTFIYEIDKWYLLDDAQDGPVTLHRLQVVRQKGLFTRSTLARPGNTEYLASIEFRLEYSNAATIEWKARLEIALLDEANREIDGYKGSEDLGDLEKHNVATIKLSTLKYGLERARKLKVVIECKPD
jgi:hypothetical protein